MTANVRIVTDQKEDVLRVPNAALRFRPPGIEAEVRDRPGGGQRAGGPGGGTGPGGGAGRASVTRGRVWVLDAAGKPTSIPIQLGISDGTNTEVTGGDITEQQQVLVGVGGDRAPGASTTGGPRLKL
jgi:HlyD family secretion protein